MPADPEVLKTPEAAKFLDVDVQTLIKAADSGEIPCWKTPGGHRRFRRQALLDLLDRRSSTTEPAEAVG